MKMFVPTMDQNYMEFCFWGPIFYGNLVIQLQNFNGALYDQNPWQGAQSRHGSNQNPWRGGQNFQRGANIPWKIGPQEQFFRGPIFQ